MKMYDLARRHLLTSLIFNFLIISEKGLEYLVSFNIYQVVCYLLVVAVWLLCKSSCLIFTKSFGAVIREKEK